MPARESSSWCGMRGWEDGDGVSLPQPVEGKVKATTHRMLHTPALLALSVYLAACILSQTRLQAQDAARITPGKPVLTTEAYFTDISSVVRLASGDLVVADPGGEELVLVARESGRMRVVGRGGEGPGEYRAPQMIFAYQGDSVLLYDPRLLRISVFDGRAQYRRAVSAGTLRGGAIPIAAGDRGQVFFRGLNGLDGEGAVIRLSMQTGRIDTVARLAVPKLVDITDSNARAIGKQVWRVMPYSDVDAFVALAGGGHMIARSRANRLEWYDTRGRMTSTTAFPGKRSPMTDSIRKTVTPVQMQAMLPATLPAFEYYAVVRSASNRVWIRAAERVGDESIWYGFSPGEGKPRVLTLPRGARLVGAFEPWLIVARRNASELQQIEIYRAP